MGWFGKKKPRVHVKTCAICKETFEAGREAQSYCDHHPSDVVRQISTPGPGFGEYTFACPVCDRPAAMKWPGKYAAETSAEYHLYQAHGYRAKHKVIEDTAHVAMQIPMQ